MPAEYWQHRIGCALCVPEHSWMGCTAGHRWERQASEHTPFSCSQQSTPGAQALTQRHRLWARKHNNPLTEESYSSTWLLNCHFDWISLSHCNPPCFVMMTCCGKGHGRVKLCKRLIFDSLHVHDECNAIETCCGDLVRFREMALSHQFNMLHHKLYKRVLF